MNALKLLGLFLVVITQVSCKTYQKVDWIKPLLPKEERSKSFETRQLSRITEGDYLSVLTKDGMVYDFTYMEIRNDSINGLFTQKNNKRIKVPIESGILISEIQALKVKRANIWGSLGIGIAISLVSWLIVKESLNVGFLGI